MLFSTVFPENGLTGDAVIQVMLLRNGVLSSLKQNDLTWDIGNQGNCFRFNLDIKPSAKNPSLFTSFTNFSTTTANLPAGNCQIYIRLYSLMQVFGSESNFNNGVGNFMGVVFDNVKIMPQILGAASLNLETRVEPLNQNIQSLKVDLGDAPVGGYNSGLIYKNIIFEAADMSVLSSAWDFKGGSNPLTHIYWLSNEYKVQLTNPSEIIQCDLQSGVGMFDFSKVIIEKDNSNKALIIHRGDYNDKSGIFSGEIMRVFTEGDIDLAITTEDGTVITTEDGNPILIEG
jgi:hypothetical protein